MLAKLASSTRMPSPSHSPSNSELVGEDRRNMPCTVPQLRFIPCSISGGAVGQPRHSLPGLVFAALRKSAAEKRVSKGVLPFACSGRRKGGWCRQQVTREVSSSGSGYRSACVMYFVGDPKHSPSASASRASHTSIPLSVSDVARSLCQFWSVWQVRWPALIEMLLRQCHVLCYALRICNESSWLKD
jgi:hypothetical protein